MSTNCLTNTLGALHGQNSLSFSSLGRRSAALPWFRKRDAEAVARLQAEQARSQPDPTSQAHQLPP